MILNMIIYNWVMIIHFILFLPVQEINGKYVLMYLTNCIKEIADILRVHSLTSIHQCKNVKIEATPYYTILNKLFMKQNK